MLAEARAGAGGRRLTRLAAECLILTWTRPIRKVGNDRLERPQGEAKGGGYRLRQMLPEMIQGGILGLRHRIPPIRRVLKLVDERT
jgi:hypothetical protein